jgi:hypothetical protein
MLDVSVDPSLSPYNTFKRSCTENCHNYQVKKASAIIETKGSSEKGKKFPLI